MNIPMSDNLLKKTAKTAGDTAGSYNDDCRLFCIFE